jgi:hypothetical protein
MSVSEPLNHILFGSQLKKKLNPVFEVLFYELLIRVIIIIHYELKPIIIFSMITI